MYYHGYRVRPENLYRSVKVQRGEGTPRNRRDTCARARTSRRVNRQTGDGHTFDGKRGYALKRYDSDGTSQPRMAGVNFRLSRV